MAFTDGDGVFSSASCCSCVNATTGFNEPGNSLTSPLNNDVVEFLLQPFAMGACREPGVTVLIAVGTYVGYNLSAVIQFSMAAVMPTYSFWLLLSGEMHFEMI